MSFALFLFVLLPPVAFLACLFALHEKPLAAPMACFALCVLGLLFLVTASSPFGYEYESSRYGSYQSFYISKYLQYVALWVASSFAVAAANSPERGSLLQGLGFSLRRDTPASKNNASFLEISNQLKEVKLLLDEGVLTQEEYDLKKKDLMGL